MATTTEAQLAEVQAAISAVMVGGQEYRIGSRTMRRADLPELVRLEKELLARLSDEAYSTRVYVAWGGRR